MIYKREFCLMCSICLFLVIGIASIGFGAEEKTSTQPIVTQKENTQKIWRITGSGDDGFYCIAEKRSDEEQYVKYYDLLIKVELSDNYKEYAQMVGAEEIANNKRELAELTPLINEMIADGRLIKVPNNTNVISPEWERDGLRLLLKGGSFTVLVEMADGKLKGNKYYAYHLYDWDTLLTDETVYTGFDEKESSIYGAFDRLICDAFHQAIDSGDKDTAATMVMLKRVFEIKKNTKCKIVQYNNATKPYCRIEVMEGPHKGKKLWVISIAVKQIPLK